MRPTDRLLPLVLSCLCASTAWAQAVNERWSAQFTQPGLQGRVFGLGVWQGQLVAGGFGFQSRGQNLGHVARFDGVAWQPLGAGLGNIVRDIVEFRGDLIAAGEFRNSGSTTVNGVARWDGNAWQPLGQGLQLSFGSGPMIFDLEVYQDALYAGGWFDSAGGQPISSLARWDGSGWSAVGGGVGGGFEPKVLSLAVEGANLWVGGEFQQAGGATARNVAIWNGTHWSEPGGGIPGPVGTGVRALMPFAGRVHAGGNFTVAGTSTAYKIAAFDGAAWQPLGSGIPDWTISTRAESLAVFAGALYVGGNFITAGGVTTRAVARWDGTAWSGVGGISGSDLATTAIALQPWNGRLIVGGEFEYGGSSFTQPATVVSTGVIAFDGAEWSAVGGGEGLNAGIKALVEYQGDVIAVGSFWEAGASLATRVARWNGGRWRTLGDFNNHVHDAIVFEGDLVVTGLFTTVDGQPIQRAARWDGVAWRAMGNLGGDTLAIYNGQLYKGGLGTPQRWNGTSWEFIGTSTFGQVVDLFAHGGLLWIGGSVSGPATNLGVWDGQTVSPAPGGPPNNMVTGFGTYQGDLIVGGAFTSIGGVSARGIARFDGTGWSALGNGLPGIAVNTAVEIDGDLYAGGNFTPGTGAVSQGIARWDGAQWNALGSGIGGEGKSLLLDPRGDRLWVGGTFLQAGGKPSIHVAQWSLTDPLVGITFCLGDEPALCPCGNASEGGGGCANSTGVGARLEGRGGTVVSANALELRTDRLPPDSTTLLFGGHSALWVPAAFGNGVRCVAAPLVRIGPIRTATPQGSVVRSGFIAAANAVLPPSDRIAAGTTWHFQEWHRDASGFCGATFQASNGLSLTFQP